MPIDVRTHNSAQGWVTSILPQLLVLLDQGPAGAAALTLEKGPQRITYETADLLARPDAAEIEIPADVAYHGPRRYPLCRWPPFSPPSQPHPAVSWKRSPWTGLRPRSLSHSRRKPGWQRRTFFALGISIEIFLASAGRAP